MANFRLTIRDAFVEDAPQIANVHVETWRASYAGLLPNNLLIQMDYKAQVEAWESLLSHPEPGQHILVAEALTYLKPGNQLVGFGSCGTLRDRNPEATGEIYTLYVMPDWQNLGVGKALMNTLLGCLTAAGFSKARLWVLGDNPSRYFYEHMKGQLADERSRALAGNRMREIAYSWKLQQTTNSLQSL